MRKITILILSLFLALPTMAQHTKQKQSVPVDIPSPLQNIPHATEEELNLLMTLYNRMPISDMAKGTEYYLEHVQQALKVRKEMPWGEKIPTAIWMDFVLPPRVNNEDLDTARTVFYQSLAPRIAHLSMSDAVLEVNHWCHEHVTYEPSDVRTSSPLATLRTASGRCGEESTFLVTALRSVGIPARQVYTPRWAHTDDNHAWVEAWVDGTWYFMGACEPEAVLNLGWFNAPVSRGMLMRTRVFGNYYGSEEIVKQTPTYTEINVTQNYAPTDTIYVVVEDKYGHTVKDATVEYKLYNYAEFFTVAAKQTDKDGRSKLSAGLGDMLIWASKDGAFGFSKVSVGKERLVRIRLEYSVDHLPHMAFDQDIVPPVERANIPELTAAQRKQNEMRLAYEDSLRHKYTDSFLNIEQARAKTKELGLPETAAELLVKTRGNHQTVCNFIKGLQTAKEKEAAVRLLQVLSQKDLRDVTQEVLNDHLLANQQEESDKHLPKEVFDQYIRNPHISNELLTPFRKDFSSFHTKDIDFLKQHPDSLESFVRKYIQIVPQANMGAAPIPPGFVWMNRATDAHSRDIFYVAMARFLHIPARIDPVTGKVQRITPNGMMDVHLDASQSTDLQPAKGIIKATYQPSAYLDNPKYYAHFSISKITNDGTLKLLNYEEGELDMGGGTTYNKILKDGTSLDTGSYLLVSGTRMANGNVLSRMQFFEIKANDTTVVPLVMRHSDTEVQVIGSFNSESKYYDVSSSTERSILSTTGRGYYIIGFIGVGQEPTNHALRDIEAVSSQFEKWGKKILLIFSSQEQYEKYLKANEFSALPQNIVYGIDLHGSLLSQATEEMHLTQPTLPLFLIADTFNRVVFCKQGYTIGLGEQLLNIIHKL